MEAPVFIFSLPRSGSTLLQKILMTHSGIASIAEPWFLLPFVYSYRKQGILSEYSHVVSSKAVEDFINNLPGKEDDYLRELGKFAFSLYEKLCRQGEKYFLDKTPRYYNIIPEIARMFPGAKFIFLFRSPVQVMASVFNTWCGGRLYCYYNYQRDLVYGFKALSDGYRMLQDKAFALRYEDLVKEPDTLVRDICRYLEIDFEPDMLNSFYRQDTKGRMGDPDGVKRYKSITPETLEKWKKFFSTSYRKRFLIKYISLLDEQDFKVQGYDKQAVLDEVKALKVRPSLALRDRADLLYSEIVRIFKPNIWFSKKIKHWASREFLS